MSRPLGGYIGYDAEPATTAAPGIWTLREAEFYQRKAQWPIRFAPSTITGLQLWLDASDASTLYDATTGGSLVAADGAVARWEDKSGNARHATQGTAGARPARKTAVQGGLDVLRFDGSDDSLSVPSSTATFKFLHDGDSTIFLALKSGTTANSGHAVYALISNHAASSANTGLDIAHIDSDPSTANENVDVFVTKGLSSNWPIYSGNNNYFANNTFGVLSFVLDPANATSGNRVAIRKNGGSLSTANSPNGANQTPSSGNATYDLHVGARGNSSAFLDGDICEIILYDSALSDTDREAVENYLIGKWGIT